MPVDRHYSASATRPGVLNQRTCAAGDKLWTQHLCLLIVYWARKRSKDGSPQDTSSSGASQQEHSRCPSCLPIIITANPIQSHSKHYPTISPFCSKNPHEENKAWLSQIRYVRPVLCLLLTQPVQLRCDTPFSTRPAHTRATSQLLVCEKTI